MATSSELYSRARDIGIIIGELPTGSHNHISDVSGISVGHSSLVQGEGKLDPGKGPIRTGVTVIFPHCNNIYQNKACSGVFIANGFGKATGVQQIKEMGVIETPIAITNTLNVGLVWDAILDWMLEENPQIGISMGSVSPVVTECYDGFLNDIRGRHVKTNHVREAIDEALNGGTLQEGSIGAGTGMTVYQLKSGIGSSSRIIEQRKGGFTVGVLSVPNFGRIGDLTIKGVPVGKKLSILDKLDKKPQKTPDGSIITVIGTDAPLTSRQLERLARRAFVGISRTGSMIGNTSGDFIFAFSTSNLHKHYSKKPTISTERIDSEGYVMDDLFRASIEATEESIINAMLMSPTMKGRDDNEVYNIPVDELLNILKEHKAI